MRVCPQDETKAQYEENRHHDEPQSLLATMHRLSTAPRPRYPRSNLVPLPEVWQLLAKHVSPDEGLKKLHLDWNDGMDEGGGAALTSALQTNRNLEDVRNDENNHKQATKRTKVCPICAYTSSRCSRLPLQQAAELKNAGKQLRNILIQLA